jgi:glutamate receptor, ionotropic, invertebrate
MNDFKYHYLFTSFDIETFEMEDFRYNFVNITAFRLIDPHDVFVKETLNNMEKFSHQFKMKFKRNLALDVITLKYSLI